MKTKLSALTLLLSVSLASAQTVPNLLSYQGRVTDASGVLIGNSAPVNRAVTFRIYSGSSGGSALYAETQTATISGGEFSVLIGNGTGVSGSPGPSAPASPVKTLNDTLNSTAYQSLYLGITVDDGVPSTVDAEISPRQQLVSGAFAFRAGVAQAVVSGAVNTAMIGDSQISTNKVAASAITSAKIADANITNAKLANSTITATKLDTTSIGVWTPSGNNVYRSAGNVGIGQTNPGFPLNFANALGDKISLWGNSGAHFGFGIQNNLLQIHTDTSAADVAFGSGSSASFTETMRVKGNGNVGIGTAVPVAKLDVNGTGRFGNDTAKIGNIDVGFFGDGANIGLRAPANGASWFQSASGASTWMQVANSGNVGIRNINASSALQVTGVIHAHDSSVGPDNGYNGVIRTTRPQSVGQHINMTRAGNAVWSLGYVPNSNTFGIGGGAANDTSFNPFFRIATNGRTMINTTDSTQGDLNVGTTGLVSVGSRNGSAGYCRVRYDNAGRFFFEGFNTSINNGSWRGFSIDGNSDIDWQSDRRLKKNIVDAEPMLDRLMQLPFRRYNWKDTTDVNPIKEFGVIAQEVEPLFPDLIGRGEDGIMTVGYTSFATIACKAIQELKVETDASLESLSSELEEKDARIVDLEARLSALEKLITAAQ